MKNRNHKFTITILVLLILATISCEKLVPKAAKPEDALDAPLEHLTLEQNRMFLEGADEFDEIYTNETGLGPIFVASSCGSCHAGDNRGHPFTTLTRFGQNSINGNTFLNQGGPQLQHNFINGYTAEQIPSGATSSKFIAPIVAGSGFLELVSEADILSKVDSNDANGDGISGRVNWNVLPDWVVPFTNSVSKNGKYICRFGKKASTYNLHQQTVQAFNQDIGITTTYMPQNPFNYASGTNPVPTSDPDISDNSVNATVFYLQVLQTPLQRNANDDDVKNGFNIFKQINCNGCHTEKLQTSFSPIAALSYKTFYPYTDLLLHDMGATLDDNYTEGTAFTNEWRTAPLWGLGLATQAQGGAYYLMHDGRANSIEQAIEMHDGEAKQSKIKFTQLSSTEKEMLLKFLKSL